MEIPSEMQHQAMGYDRAATMFSPDGHLLQVEYADKTVKLGSASIGFACKDGALIVSDKRVRDKLIAPESASKIFEIDEHIIASTAGILSDARMLVDYAQVLAQQNKITFDSPVEPISVIRAIADKKQMFTQYGGARPFGVVIMVAGTSRNKSYLYTADVTGNFFSYKANAIGENDEKIREMLRKDYTDGMSIDESLKFAMEIFREVLGKNFEFERFEAAYVKTGEKNIVRMEGEELKKIK